MKLEEILTYDDVLLKPKYSEVRSRSEVDLSVDLGKGFVFKVPFIPANMSSVISREVLSKVFQIGGMAFLHRFCSMEEQLEILRGMQKEYGHEAFKHIGVSVGVKEIDKLNLKAFDELGVRIVCIDIAHLDSANGMEMIGYVAKTFPEWLLVAGNVATGSGAENAWIAGADVVKVGIGSGSICSTRIETGAGFSQLSAIVEVSEARKQLPMKESIHHSRKLSFISDGGAREAGDCVKSLCFAEMIMLGSYFAGCQESPGEEIEINGQKLKPYHGSSTHKLSRIEGVKAAVKSKGPILDLMQKLIDGVQSGCSYQNSKNLQELKVSPHFVKITSSGLIESRIHDVIVPLHY